MIVKKAMSEKARIKMLDEVMSFIRDKNKEDILNILENTLDGKSDDDLRESLRCLKTWNTSKKGI